MQDWRIGTNSLDKGRRQFERLLQSMEAEKLNWNEAETRFPVY